jgi:alkylation response protein AidB-like acyl-CoA dehydrogenase
MMPRVIFNSEHEQFRDAVRRFYQREITPLVPKWLEQGFLDRSVYQALGAQGYLLMWASEDFGGLAIEDLRYEQIFQEENIRHGDPVLYANLHSMIVAPYMDKL